MFDIDKFVIIDNHSHSLLKKYRELDEIGFRQSFSESKSLSVLKNHLPSSVHYIDMVEHLLKLFNIKSEHEFLSFRSEQPETRFVKMLWDAVSIGALIVDDGFASGEAMTLDELARISGRPVYHCLRMEPLMESSILEANSLDEACNNFEKKLFPQGQQKVIGLKSICGYRGGLQLMNPSNAEARSDFDLLKKSLGSAQSLRLAKRPVYHFMLLKAFEIAAQHGVPVQVHTGIGDDDANLVDCNPALMQDLFRSQILAKTSFVLLHCFPYVHEAAFMCSLYGNVYMDLSLSMSLASPRAARLVGDALSLAPASKILAGTDGHSSPESHWYGALCWKRGLTFSVHEMINANLLTQRKAEELCALILHDNAIKLYQLEGLA
jgi:hypothetical protein